MDGSTPHRFTATRLQVLDLEGAGAGLALDADVRERIVEAVRSPSVLYRLYLETEGTRTVFDGWADRVTVTLQAEVDPTVPTEVLHGGLALLPSYIGTLVNLGPRSDPTDAQAVVTRAELASALVEGDHIDGVGPVRGVWTLRWMIGPTEGEGITVVDCGPGRALWTTAGVEGDRLLVRDHGTMGVWTVLGGLLALPGDSPSVRHGDLHDRVLATDREDTPSLGLVEQEVPGQ